MLGTGTWRAADNRLERPYSAILPIAHAARFRHVMPPYW